MSKPTLTYFDFSGSRGDECRLALSVAGVDFNDNRIKREQWIELKPTTPFGSMPIFEIPGKPPLAQSNAILTYIGREHGLLPTDSFEAARHEALMAYAEEMRHHTSPILRISGETEKLEARKELATKYLPSWATNVERQIGDGPFVGGATISVADLKLYMVVRWIVSGAIDHVPKETFAPFAKLTRLYRAVAEHPKVASWVSSH
jgi:glutathione S-transferase